MSRKVSWYIHILHYCTILIHLFTLTGYIYNTTAAARASRRAAARCSDRCTTRRHRRNATRCSGLCALWRVIRPLSEINSAFKLWLWKCWGWQQNTSTSNIFDVYYCVTIKRNVYLFWSFKPEPFYNYVLGRFKYDILYFNERSQNAVIGCTVK